MGRVHAGEKKVMNFIITFVKFMSLIVTTFICALYVICVCEAGMDMKVIRRFLIGINDFYPGRFLKTSIYFHKAFQLSCNQEILCGQLHICNCL
jgi:hypothetical protein